MILNRAWAVMLAGLLASALAGCAPEDAPGAPADPAAAMSPSNAAATGPTSGSGTSPGAAPESPVLRPDGYDTIRIGAAPAQAEGYALSDDGSYEDVCRIYASDRLPNAYAIVEEGRIMRFTVFDRPGTDAGPIRTDRGIGPGSTEAEVRAAYSPLREQPHHYVEAPAKDMFFGGSEQEPGLRFEVGSDGRVTNLHAGLEPVLSYVEGCS